MKIEKIFKYSQKDLVDFGLNSYLYKRGKFLIVITSIFIMALAMLIYINEGLGQLEMLIALIYLFVLIAASIAARTQMKKAYKSSHIFKEEQEFIITKDEFRGKSPTGESVIEWGKFHEFVVFKNSIALYISTRQAFILPKKVLAQDEIEQLIDFLSTDERTKEKVKISKYI